MMTGRPISLANLLRLFKAGDGGAGRHRLADADEQLLEKLAVFGVADGLDGRAQSPDIVFIQDAGIGQLHGQVKPGLPAEGGQQAHPGAPAR